MTCIVQLLQAQRVRDAEAQQLQHKCSTLEHDATVSSSNISLLTLELETARCGLREQQQQLVAAVDLQGRTHMRLMQLTQEHDQVSADCCSSRLSSPCNACDLCS